MLLGYRFVPPAPQVLAQLYADYLRYRATTRKPMSFKRYLKRIGFTDPTARFKGATTESAEFPPGLRSSWQCPSERSLALFA